MLLCVDSDAAERTATAETLRDAGFEVVEAGSLADARDRLDDAIDVLVTEQSLPDGTGLELIGAVRETAPDTACILFTGTPADDLDTGAVGDVIAEYLSKEAPEARTELVDLVEHSLTFRSQTAYPLPENEEARLAALDRYAVAPESLGESFNRLTEIATELFDLDAAAVGLIDAHEQRFLGCHGVSFGTIDREETVCTYAMVEPGVTVIEDVREDPRFADNEGIAAADIRFYASAPVETDGGEVLGTFCIYDDSPRSLNEREHGLLGLLADEAMEQLTLRRRLRDDGGNDE